MQALSHYNLRILGLHKHHMTNQEQITEEGIVLPEGETEHAPLTSMIELFTWYKRNLCQPDIRDCRGHRVRFLDTDFVHLIKLVDKYRKEPKNKGMTIKQILCGRVELRAGRFDVRRAKELVLARSIIEEPSMIVPNWQVMGRANPGEAYIRNFGTEECPKYRVLICGFAGIIRRPVTIFPRERFAQREISRIIWP